MGNLTGSVPADVCGIRLAPEQDVRNVVKFGKKLNVSDTQAAAIK